MYYNIFRLKTKLSSIFICSHYYGDTSQLLGCNEMFGVEWKRDKENVQQRTAHNINNRKLKMNKRKEKAHTHAHPIQKELIDATQHTRDRARARDNDEKHTFQYSEHNSHISCRVKYTKVVRHY